MAELGPRARKAERRHAQATETALSACQEELARVRQEWRNRCERWERLGGRESNRAEAAEAARDELARVGHRVLILDDAEPGEVSEAHVAVIGELRAALSSEATKGEQAPPPPVRPPGVGITETGGRSK